MVAQEYGKQWILWIWITFGLFHPMLKFEIKTSETAQDMVLLPLMRTGCSTHLPPICVLELEFNKNVCVPFFAVFWGILVSFFIVKRKSWIQSTFPNRSQKNGSMENNKQSSSEVEWPEWIEVIHFIKSSTKRKNTMYLCRWPDCNYKSQRKQKMVVHITTHEEKKKKVEQTEAELWQNASAGRFDRMKRQKKVVINSDEKSADQLIKMLKRMKAQAIHILNQILCVNLLKKM